MKIFKTLRKRGLALFLVLTMCISLLPVNALAAEWQEATHTCNEDGWTCSEAVVCEKPEHVHDGESCVYAECQIPEHSHAEAGCVQSEDGSWSCGQEEHSHADDVQACILEAHTHQDGVCQFPATHIAPSDAVVSFLNAVKAIPVEVAAADEAAITAARSAYGALTPADQGNYAVIAANETLTAAEAALDAAKKAEEDLVDDTNGVGTDSMETASLEEPVKLDPAALVEMNGEDGFVSLYFLFAYASQTGWYEGWLDYGTFLAELSLESEDGKVETIGFAPYVMQDDYSTPVELTYGQVYYNGEAVTVYAGVKVEEIPEEQTPETMKNTSHEMNVGDSITLEPSEKKQIYKWSIQSGNDVVELTNSTQSSATVKALKSGTATIYYQTKRQNSNTYITQDTFTITVKDSTSTSIPPVADGYTRVYVYIRLDAAASGGKTAVEVAKEKAQEYGWKVNDKNWVTIGYIDVPVSELVAATSYTGSYNGLSGYSALPATIQNALNSGNTAFRNLLNFYKDSSGKSVQDYTRDGEVIDFTLVTWSGQGNNEDGQMGLHTTSNGADGYTSGYTWHLDGTLFLGGTISYDWGSTVPPTIAYTAAENGEEVTIALPSGDGGKEGEIYTVDTTYSDGYTVYSRDAAGHPTAKYVFSGWNPKSGEFKGNENFVIRGSWTRTPYYTVTGSIDNGGAVTNSTQYVESGTSSTAMVFTPAEDYLITGVEVNGVAVTDFTCDSTGAYTYAAQTVTQNISVVVTTSQVKKSVSIEKSVKDASGNPVSSAKVGDTLTYTIKVTNTGSVDLTNLTIQDSFDGKGTVKDSAGKVLNKGADGKYTFTIASLPWAAGSNTQIITYKYEVVAADAGAEMTNLAVAGVDTETGEDPDKPTNKTETPVDPLTIQGITKTLTDATPITITAGAAEVTLHYTITVTGDAGAKFIVSDEGAVLDTEQNNTVEAATDADNIVIPNTWTGSIADNANSAVIYVTKTFPVKNGKVVTATGSGTIATSITNTATVTPGDNAELPDGKEELTGTAAAYQVVYTYEGAVPAGASPSPAYATEIVPAGTEVTVKAKASAPGHTFDGWRKGTDTTATESGTKITVTANVEFKGAFAEATAGYTYIAKVGTGHVVLGNPANPSSTDTQVSETVGQVTGKVYTNGTITGTSVQGATALPAEGWQFDGWYSDEACTRKINENVSRATISVQPVGGLYSGGTFYAKFTAIDYTVKYDLDGGKLGEATTVEAKSVNWAEKDLLPGTPTKDGYDFGGWFLMDKSTDPAGIKGEAVTDQTEYKDLAVQATSKEQIDKEITLIAKWTEKTADYTYSVSADAASNGGRVVLGSAATATENSVSETVGQANGMVYEGGAATATSIQGATAVADAGWEFEGWYQGTTMVSTDIHYTPGRDQQSNLYTGGSYVAKFTKTNYTVKYDTRSGSALADLTDQKWDSTNLFNGRTATRAGYSFLGWFMSEADAQAKETAVKNNTSTDVVEVVVATAFSDIASLDGKLTTPASGQPYITLYAAWQVIAPEFPEKDPDHPGNDGVVKSATKVNGTNVDVDATTGKVTTVVQPGDKITYQVVIKPKMNGSVVTGFTVEDPKLAGAENIKVNDVAVVTSGEGTNFAAVPGAENTWKYTIADPQADVEEFVLTYTYTVKAEDAEPTPPEEGKPQYIKNSATVTLLGAEDTSSAPEKDTEEVEYQEPAVTITKEIKSIKRSSGETYTKNNVPNGKVKPGDTITWTITVTNTKNVVAAGVKVEDNFTVTDVEGKDIPNQSVIWTNGNDPRLPDGITVPVATKEQPNLTFEATYLVPTNNERILGATIGNTVCEKGKDPDKDQETEIKVENPAFTVEKSVSGAEKVTVDGKTELHTKAGTELTYTIKVTNTGNVPLSNLVINDTFTVGGTAVAAGKVTITGESDAAMIIADASGKLTGFQLTNSLDEEGVANIIYTYTVAVEDAGSKLTNVVVLKENDPGNPTVDVEADKLNYSVTKELFIPTDGDEQNQAKLSGVTVKDGRLVVDKDATSITLLYKITVTGDAGAKYTIEDPGASPAELTGKLEGTAGQAGIPVERFVTMTFSVTKNEDGTLTFRKPGVENAEDGLTNTVNATGSKTTNPPEEPEVTAESYTVTYRYTNDVAASIRTDLTTDAYRTAIYKEGDEVTVAADAVAPGYTFHGWTIGGKTKDTVQITDSKFNMPGHDVVLEGYFTPDAYIMKYELHGGTATGISDDDNVEWLSTDNRVPTESPTRAGYKFVGWYLSSTGDKGTTLTDADKREGTQTYQQLADGNTTIHTTKTITLHAGWEEVAPTFPEKPEGQPGGGVVKASETADDAVVQPGDTITYKVTITPEKTTDAEVKGVVKSFTIQDAKLAGAANIKLDGTVVTPTLVENTADTFLFELSAPDQEPHTVTYEYTVVESDKTVDGKEYIVNKATVTLFSDTKSSNPEESNEVTVKYDEPDVSVSKKITAVNDKPVATPPDMVKAGDKITWTITVKNSADVPALVTNLKDTITVGGVEVLFDENAGLVLTDAQKGETVNNFTVSPKQGDTDGTRTLTASYTAKKTETEGDKTISGDEGKVIANKVQLGDNPTDKEQDTSTVTVENRDYTIEKVRTDNATSVKPGTELGYKITVVNTGNVDLENLVISDVLSYTETGATGAPNGKVGFENTDNVTWNADAKTFTVIKVGPGADNKVEITYTYTVSNDDAGHTIKNTAKVEGKETSPDPTPVEGAYKVEYYFDGILADAAKENGEKYEPKTGSANVGDEILSGITIEKKNVSYDGKNYALDKVVNTATGKVVAGGVENNTVKIYYLPDTTETEVPDAYEATVIYQIEGGTWTDKTGDDATADRTEYVPMKEWNEDSQTWVDISRDVKLTDVPDGTREDDNVNPGAWGHGTVEGVKNSATADHPSDQVLAAENTYIFKLTFEPLEADVVVPAGEGAVAADSHTWIYDGRAHGVTAEVTKAPEGSAYKLFYSTDDGKTWTEDAPDVTNVADTTAVKVEARDASANGYKTLETSYTLTILPRPVTITTPSASKEYDGTALTAGPATIRDLVNGETATVTATGSQTAVGSSSNGYSITWGTADANNYEIRRNLGTLTVSTATEPPVIPPVTPPVIIPNPPTPLGPGPDTGTTIEDEEVPLANAVGLNDTDHFAYIIGYENDTVRPLNNITRAEAVTIFFRLMTDEYRAANWSTENSFSDVSVGNWYNNAVSTVQKAGALEHFVPDGKFLPNQAITRAEFASIAAGFVSEEITGENVGDFSDTEGHWAALAIRKAVEAGWINGVGGNRFAPDETITRAEVMTMINRMLDRVPDKEHMLPDMKKWIDNPEDAWYYEAVQEATNDHDYERDEMGIVETWTALKATRDWKALEAEWAANGGALTPAEPAEPVEGEGETGAEADADASDAEEQ